MKIERIREAMDAQRMLQFHYYSPRGESARRIEPYYLIFQWLSWYVWRYCAERGLQAVQAEPDGGIRVKALFDPVCKWRLVEEFSADCFEEQENGRLLFRADYTDKENLMTWLMSFRDQVTLLEPEEIRAEIAETLCRMLKKYS